MGRGVRGGIVKLKYLAAYVGVLLVSLACGWWFFSNYETYEENRHVGPSAAARQNPLLAVERLFRRVGLAIQTRQTLVSLPPTDQVLMLVAPRRHLGFRRSQQLLQWARAGGHLIFAPREKDPGRAGDHPGSEEEDPLLKEIGVAAQVSGSVDSLRFGSLRAGSGARATGRFRARFPGFEGQLRMARYSDVKLVDEAHEASFVVRDDRGQAHIVHRRFGRGFVTVIAERAFLGNARIGERDHAEVARQLVHLGKVEPAGVWIVVGDEMPGIVTLLVWHAWPALVAGLLLLSLWLWRVGGRFGPAQPEVALARRSLREHLEAAGTFLWRRRASAALLASVRRRLGARMLARHPELACATPEEMLLRLAPLSGIPADRLRSALLVETIADPRAFVQAVRDLQRLFQS